jgi:hypothetical protein
MIRERIGSANLPAYHDRMLIVKIRPSSPIRAMMARAAEGRPVAAAPAGLNALT